MPLLWLPLCSFFGIPYAQRALLFLMANTCLSYRISRDSLFPAFLLTISHTSLFYSFLFLFLQALFFSFHIYNLWLSFSLCLLSCKCSLWCSGPAAPLPSHIFLHP